MAIWITLTFYKLSEKQGFPSLKKIKEAYKQKYNNQISVISKYWAEHGWFSLSQHKCIIEARKSISTSEKQGFPNYKKIKESYKQSTRIYQ